MVIMPIDKVSLYKFIGKRLQNKRMALGITQADLAEQVKLTRTSVANIEAGNQNTPLHIIYEMCSILQLKPGGLFPSLEEISSPIEVADSIAKQMVNAGSGKAAASLKILVRGKEAKNSDTTGDAQEQGGKAGN